MTHSIPAATLAGGPPAPPRSFKIIPITTGSRGHDWPTVTVWRALSEVGQVQLTRVNAAAAAFRRHWWGLLAARPEGFPWLRVAGRELTGATVVDLDASLVFAASTGIGTRS